MIALLYKTIDVGILVTSSYWKRNAILPLIFTFSLLSYSCNRASDTGKELAQKSKRELLKQSGKMMDKLFPKFDSAQADTENNRKRFKEFIQVDLTPDIHGIYCFDDRMGIDSDFSFAFYCNYETSRKIIEKHHLKADTSENSRVSKGLQHDFPWWNKDSIALLPFYSADSGRKLHRNFWYDSLQQKAYYFEYDL